MSEKISNIAKNTSYFTLALVVQKIITFSYFVMIARAIGPDDLGKYYFAVSYTTIFGIFIDIGLANVLSREVPKHQKDAGRLLGTVLSIKLPLAVATALVAFAGIRLAGYPSVTVALVSLAGISMILDSFTQTFFAVIRGFHNLKFESLASIIFQLIVLVSGALVVSLGGGVVFLMAGLAAASIFNFAYSSFLLYSRFGISAWPSFEKAGARSMALLAFPFALYAVFQRGFTYFDTLLLSYFSGDRAVGIYQIPFKIIFALQFLPMAFTASLYPAMSLYWKENRSQLGITFERAMNYLLVISVPIAFGTFALAKQIVLLFKSDYLDAVLPLQIIILALPFIFLNFPIGSLLNACDRQKTNTLNMAAALAVSLAMNLVLIPAFAYTGAAVTVLAANVFLFMLGLAITGKITRYRGSRILLMALKVLIAALAMAVAAYSLKDILPIIFNVALSGILYFALLFAFKAVRREDAQSIISSFKRV